MHSSFPPDLPSAPAEAPPLLVVAFCAAWCNTCDDFRKTFDVLASDRRDTRFVWLDIEDDAQLVGEIDVENFPTIAVFVGDRPLHFGISLPHGPIVARLLDALDVRSPAIDVENALADLPARLAAGPVPPVQSPSKAATN